jgi:hypothetical protein
MGVLRGVVDVSVCGLVFDATTTLTAPGLAGTDWAVELAPPVTAKGTLIVHRPVRKLQRVRCRFRRFPRARWSKSRRDWCTTIFPTTANQLDPHPRLLRRPPGIRS